MNLAESIRSERRVRQPLPCTMHLRAQRSRRAKGPLASTLERPQHRPLATKHTVKPSLPTKPARPHTAPEAMGRQQRRKQAEPPTSPGFHNFRPREAPPMPALSSEELERLGLRAKQECGVCLRQYLLSNLPGVTTRRAITRLRENWVKELGTAEPVNVDVRTSKPAQYYSEVRLCVFCYQFVRSGLNDGPDNDQTASPPTARLNGSPLPARYGRHRPRLGDRNLLAGTSAAPTAQAKATAAAVEEAVLQAERMAEQRRIVNKQQPRILSETNVVTSSMGAQFGSLGRKRRWRVDAQRPQQRSDEYRSTRRSLQGAHLIFCRYAAEPQQTRLRRQVDLQCGTDGVECAATRCQTTSKIVHNSYTSEVGFIGNFQLRSYLSSRREKTFITARETVTKEEDRAVGRSGFSCDSCSGER